MSLDQGRIHDIIVAHVALAKAYDNAVRYVESQPLTMKYRLDVPNPFALLRGIASIQDKLQLLTMLIFYFTLRPRMLMGWWKYFLLDALEVKGILGNATYILAAPRPFVKYLINAHMKRNYERLYGLYLRELMAYNKGSPGQNEIDELRQISSDMKSYSDTLPGAKKMIATIIAILTVSATIMELLDLRQRITAIVPPETIGAVIALLIMVPLMAGALLTVPMGEAFKLKRALFLKARTYFQLSDIFLGKEEELYLNSIYKLENELYALLGNGAQKPKEIPLDFLFEEGLAIAAVLLMGFALIVVLFFQIDIISVDNFWVRAVAIIMLVLLASAGYFIGIPLVFGLHIRHRAQLI